MYSSVKSDPDLLENTDFQDRVDTSFGMQSKERIARKIHPANLSRSSSDITRAYTQNQIPYKYGHIWKRAFLRIKARRAIEKLTQDVVLYGTTPEGDSIETEATVLLNNKYKSKIMKSITKLQDTKPVYVISPDSILIKLWKIILGICLAYTTIFEAYSLAFINREIWDVWTVIAVILDIVFFIDFLRLFFTAYKKQDGSVETRLLNIWKEYAMGWMLLDMFGAIPFGIIDAVEGSELEDDVEEYSFWKIGKIPKVYMILRLLRLLKMIKGYLSGDVADFLTNYCKLNPPEAKLVLFVTVVTTCIHVIACIFYFAARVQGLSEFTWVYSYTIDHKPDDTKYLCSVYWAITTLATIGYGDITPKNDLERCICIVWMIFGVGFYSYTIGSLSSLISSIDSQQAVLNQRIYTISEFSEEAGLDSATQTNILNAIKYNSSQSMMSLSDKMNLFNELPRNLRYEIASRMYSGAVSKLAFFKGRSKSFIVNVMPFLTPHMFADDHKVYQVGDFSDEMYFILSGRIMYVYGKKSFVYKSYLKGSYFGEIEIIEKIPRLDQAVTFGRCDLLVLPKDVLIQQMENFPIEADSIKRIATARKEKNQEAKMRILEAMKTNRIQNFMKDEEEDLFRKSGPGTLPSTSRRGSIQE